mmetsp:Transcript_30825/g.78043  ORF Transcript_30825/g.78043 Transcript_30825/m.78043 type:complete len:201 (-) Transcript_30825:454-1056(-)
MLLFDRLEVRTGLEQQTHELRFARLDRGAEWAPTLSRSHRIHRGTVGEQKPHQVNIPSPSRIHQRRPTARRLAIVGIGAQEQQRLHGRQLPALHRHKQWRPTASACPLQHDGSVEAAPRQGRLLEGHLADLLLGRAAARLQQLHDCRTSLRHRRLLARLMALLLLQLLLLLALCDIILIEVRPSRLATIMVHPSGALNRS